MLNSKPLNKLIFIDIETVPRYKSFFDMSENLQELFLRKFKKESEEMLACKIDHWNPELFQLCKEKVEDFYNNRAALHAEFCKIVCISTGRIIGPSTGPEAVKKLDMSGDLKMKLTTFYGDDEKELLTNFYNAFNKDVLSGSVAHTWHMVAFNGLIFDFPVIAKRMIFNGIPLPPYFDQDGRKPWDLVHLVDPKITWKMNVYDFNASLALLCELFGVGSSKDDIDGSQVRNVYYVNEDLKRIAKYCDKDVVALATLYLRMKQIPNNLVTE